MDDDENGRSTPPEAWRTDGMRERVRSGIHPFPRLRYRQRGRIVSRVVSINLQPRAEENARVLDLYFAMG